MTPWFYIISSAAFHAASFLFINYFWWCSFIFLVPVFYCARFYKITFMHGFVWGLLVYGLHMIAIWVLTIELGQGVFRFIAPALAVIWFSLFSGLWFIGLSLQNLALRFVSTLSFFIFMNTAVLAVFFKDLEGYPFVSPLLPLMQGNVLGLLPLFKAPVLLAILIGIQMLMACSYRISACLLVFLFFFSVPAKQQKGDWQKQCIAVPCAFKEHEPYERAQEICQLLITTKQKHPEKRVIVLPESVFPWPLNEHKYALKMWTDNALQNNSTLILGSYRKEGQKLLNTFYNISKSRIIFYYDKKHLIPFFEKTNSSRLFKRGNDLFLSTKESFTKGISCERWPARGSLTFTDITPVICSEGFWRMPRRKRAINLVNDSYFSFVYFRSLMRLLAFMNALESETDLFYCSWRSNF